MKTQLYVTNKEHYLTRGLFQEKILPAGSFVKIIEPKYLPQHIKDTPDYKFLMPDREVFVYCHYGIVLVPFNILRRDE